MGVATWSEAVTTARDRVGWRRQGNGPNLLEETANNDDDDRFANNNIYTNQACKGEAHPPLLRK